MRLILCFLSVTVWSCSSTIPRYQKGHVAQVFEHDYRAYTQGLEYHDGLFWESTGQYGQSSFRIWEPSSGRKTAFKSIREVFAEGLTRMGSKLYILTWKAGRCMVYDAESFEPLDSFKYEGEGWGLTHNGSQLIMSDGSDTLIFRDPETFQETGRVRVTLRGRSLGLLNELEYDGKYVWANIYQQKKVVGIDPSNGVVRIVVDLSHLPRKQDVNGKEDVLNGIAIDRATQRMFVTGKYWSKLYEIKLDKFDAEGGK